MGQFEVTWVACFKLYKIFFGETGGKVYRKFLYIFNCIKGLSLRGGLMEKIGLINPYFVFLLPLMLQSH